MSSYDVRYVFSFLILVSAAGTCFGQANQTCQHLGLVTPVHNFSVDSILGTWYTHKVYSGLAENAKPLLYRCLESNFSLTDSTFLPIKIEETFITFPDGTDVPNEVTDHAHISEENPAIWTYLTIDNGTLLEVGSVFVQTDYTNWAIEFGCSIIDNYRYESMQIWTRTRTPDPEVVAILEILVKNYGFPLANGRTVDQTNC